MSLPSPVIDTVSSDWIEEVISYHVSTATVSTSTTANTFSVTSHDERDIVVAHQAAASFTPTPVKVQSQTSSEQDRDDEALIRKIGCPTAGTPQSHTLDDGNDDVFTGNTTVAVLATNSPGSPTIIDDDEEMFF